MPAKPKTPGVVVALETFHGPNGLYVQQGETFPGNDPVVVAHGAMFRHAFPHLTGESQDDARPLGAWHLTSRLRRREASARDPQVRTRSAIVGDR